MASKLPNHLASLLRHQPQAPAASSATESGAGKAARKKAARVKRRSKAKEERAAERAEREEKKRLQETQEAEEAEEPVEPEVKTKKKKKKKLVAKKKKAPAPGGDKKASTSKTSQSFNSEAAARDQALLWDLEKKLGIAGDSKRRRKEEQQIFADLFEGEDLGIEELPSSDEEAEKSKATAAGLEALKDEDMVGLLDSILGGEPTSNGKIKAKGVKKKSKA